MLRRTNLQERSLGGIVTSEPDGPGAADGCECASRGPLGGWRLDADWQEPLTLVLRKVGKREVKELLARRVKETASRAFHARKRR